MDDIWAKLDGYTKSDYLYSSDDENHEREHIHISTKEFYQTEVDCESLCSEDVESQEVEGKKETTNNLYESLLDEMKKSELHCNSERSNVQERIDKMSAEKSQQKEELNEMQHKAQVISKSARMSATDVLSAITSSETIDHEESAEMDEYYERIRSTNTDDYPPEDSRENERKSSSSDADLPNVPPLSTTLNTGVMKSKANVARQGSMKARRKPTTMKRKSWTPGMDEFNIREQDEMTMEHMQEDQQGDTWVTEAKYGDLQGTGSFTPSDSSSEDEKEVVKPHLRSGIALPGLGDALKIQLTRSELKRPTALNLVKTAKDIKDNEVTKEDKLETLPSKPAWMKEVEERKKKPRAPARRHKTLPARCSELDTLFEQRKQLQSNETLVPESTTHEGPFVAKEALKSKCVPGEDIDPELQKMFEKRKSLKPIEVDNNTSGNGVLVKEGERPKRFHNEQIDPELSKMFDRRKNLKPLEVDSNSSVEGAVIKESERPKSFHGDQADCELNKMFERRKNLKQVEGKASNRDDTELDQVFKPRNVHLQNSQASELDKIFEKRKQLRPVQANRPPSPPGKFDDSSAVVNPRSPPAELRQTSGIVRARFHDAKLERLPSRTEVKVATVAEVEVRTARQENIQRISPESKTVRSEARVEHLHHYDERATLASAGRISLGNKSENFNLPHPPMAPERGNTKQVSQFDGRGASYATVQKPVDRNQRSNGSLNAISQHLAPEERNAGQATSGAQVAQFVFDTSTAASHATVARIPFGSNQKSIGSQAQDHVPRKASPMPSKLDSCVDHVIGAREDHVITREDNMIAARGNVNDSRDANSKNVVISPISKSDTCSFIEQLSRRPISGNSQSVCQGKSVSKPNMEARDYPLERMPVAPKIEQGWQQPCMDKEYSIPSRSHHSDLQHHRHGGEPIPPSHSQSTSSPRGLTLGTLPPINTPYPTHLPSHRHRPLPHSLSYPPNSIYPFPNHPPLNAKMSDPQFSISPHTVHSPSAPKKGRVTSPRSLRLREVNSAAREVDSKMSGRGSMVHTVAKLEDSSRLHKLTSPVEMLGDSATKSETEIRRNGTVNNIPVDERPSNNLGIEVKQDRSVRSQYAQLSANVTRYSDSFIPFSDSVNDKDMRLVRNPDRELHDERFTRAQSPDRSEDREIKRYQNPNGLSDQRLDRVQSLHTSDNQKISRLQNPDRVQVFKKSGDQEIKVFQNPNSLSDQRTYRVQSPDRSEDQRIRIVENPERVWDQRINKVENLDKSGSQKLSRFRSPGRSDVGRIDRFRSPDRSSNHNRITRSRSPNRSSDQKTNRFQNLDKSNDFDRSMNQRIRDVRDPSVRVTGSKELPSNHLDSTDNEILKKSPEMENSLSANELSFKQYKNTTEALANGLSDSKDLGNKTRGMIAGQNDMLNLESVERPKPVTVTVKSLSKSTVYGKSAVVERVWSHDMRDSMVYGSGEYGINGVVNGDAGRRGVKTVAPKGILDAQSSESAAVPKWKQELREKKRLQREKEGENSCSPRQRNKMQPPQSGNDMAEWRKRVQGIRKSWGTGESEDSTGSKDSETNLQSDHATHADVDERTNVPEFLKEFHQKKSKQNAKGDKQDNKTFV